MNIKTERLDIRNIKNEDWKELKFIIDDFQNSEYGIYDSHFPSEDEKFKNSVKRLVDSNLFFVVSNKETSEMIGYICFHNNDEVYDLGYCFHSNYKGKGYGFESCKAMITYMKELGTKGFTAGTALENTQSCKLLKKLGFVCTETEKMSFHKDEFGNDITFNGGNFLYNK